MKKREKNISKLLTKELKNKTILITGGAGSVGTALTRELLNYPVNSIRVLDINEHSLFLLGRELRNPKLRLLLGSILDKERLVMALNDVDIVIHTAALKNIEITESNPIETIETNVTGTKNLIQLINSNKIKPIIFLNISTDKAVEATTLYGITKQLGEKLTSWAGTHEKFHHFASVRLGNIFETRGNVFEVWKNESSLNSCRAPGTAPTQVLRNVTRFSGV